MIGISIYAGLDYSKKELLEYMNRANDLGVRTMFTSAHIPEVKENFLEDFKSILEESSKLGFTSIVDISKNYYEKIDIKNYKIDFLRFDYGFTFEEMAKIIKENSFGASINATTLTEEEVNEFIKHGVDMSKVNACHNFYPRRDTGISEELFIEKNKFIKKYGMNTLAFIPSQNKKRGPVYEGLPTLEKHRYLKAIVSAQHLMKLDTDFIIIGDQMASDEELKALSSLKKDVTTLPIILSDGLGNIELELLKATHTNRMDPGEFVIRSQESRLIKNGDIIQKNTIKRDKYAVTIDNILYNRYEGELQILKKDLHEDNRVNVVGDASEGALLIDNLAPGERFNFYI
ncbi:MupG family TIM beta-alpha barrel fold protein [Wansuia hejianensis]|uniref:DUF871 domain-containing protein n=1 Tax=Wansuia hejianensis TaxID=2763667 RepID=A0A926F1G3_9FIRM|nr:MupG family TIM beta-alpha barrel fold protein [Wansuia hejianensis]MBC8591317.1 DUF871 domain-containing protein [Wansuia hejianensis]